MQHATSTAGTDSSGTRQRYEEKTVRALRGREQVAIAKAQAEGWEVAHQDTGTLHSTLELRKPRPSTTVESLRDRLPVVGGMADAHRPLLLIGLMLVVLAIILTPLALLTSGDEEEAARNSSAPDTSSSAPPEETTADEVPNETSEPEKASAEEVSAPAHEYTGPAYEIAEVDVNGVLGEQDQVWVYTDALDVESPGYQVDVKLIIEDVAREQGTPNLSVNVVTDREVIEANSNNTITDFMNEHAGDYYQDVVAPKEKTAWVATYTGGMDPGSGRLSTAESAYFLDWWPAGDHSSEAWKPEVAG